MCKELPKFQHLLFQEENIIIFKKLTFQGLSRHFSRRISKACSPGLRWHNIGQFEAPAWSNLTLHAFEKKF